MHEQNVFILNDVFCISYGGENDVGELRVSSLINIGDIQQSDGEADK